MAAMRGAMVRLARTGEAVRVLTRYAVGTKAVADATKATVTRQRMLKFVTRANQAISRGLAVTKR